MNPQPVSLADELRKLAAQITQDLQGDGFFKPMNASYVLGRIEGRLISALLAKYAVAEPQRQCWYSDNVVCPYSNQRDDKPAVLIPAHAAEQPKLTGHQLRKASEDAALERGCMDMPEDFFERVAIRVNRLLTSPVAPPPQELTCIGCGWPMPSCKCKPSTSFDYVPNAVHAPPAPPSQERASDEQLAEEWREAHLVHRKLLPAIVELIAETRATAAKLAREEALEELHGRIAIRFAAREPSSGAWAYQASVAKEAYLAALAAQPAPQDPE